MEDLFYREQKILDSAMQYLAEIKNGKPCDTHEYEIMAKEYGRLLKQLRRVTKISDRTTVDLNTSKLDLLDKVHYDTLTGIYSRRFMEERIKHIIRSVARSGGMLSVLMIDIDYFKQYNDTYGHSTGDQCLKMTADALKNSIARADDFVARYGGEEFVAVLPNTNEEGASFVAKTMLKNIINRRIPHQKSTVSDYVTVSIGITTGTAKHTHKGGDYIKRADEALYMSKNSGRNRSTFVHFEEEIE